MNTKQQEQRKQLLVLTSTFPRWDGDREPPFVFELSSRLAQYYRVMVLAPHVAGAMTDEQLGELEVHRFRYFITRWQNLTYNGGILANLKRNSLNYLLIPFFVFSEFFSLFLLLRKSKVDLIHAHWIIPQGLVAVTARACSRQKPSIICTSHGGDLYGLSGKFATWIKRQVIRRVDKLTVVSEAMRRYATALSGRTDIDVIPMGVDLLGQFTPSTSEQRNPHKILFAGRLVEKKGVQYLIDAMPEILKHLPHTSLLIAGDGPERPNLEKSVKAAALEQHVKFVGALSKPELQQLYNRASVFVGPSIVASGGDQEGLGLVFVEAMGCECAVVASDLPAIQDVVIENVTGLVCEQKNSADITRKVLRLLEDPDLRESLGRAGRQHVLGQFDWEIVSKKYTELIEEYA